MAIDRSPCCDPFFDLYTEEKRPLVSGLCRAFKKHQLGDRFIYVTRVDGKAAADLGVPVEKGQLYYAMVASMTVVKVHASHEAAAATFSNRRYVHSPALTPYPPNLIASMELDAAVDRLYSVVSDQHGKKYIPDQSTDGLWRKQYYLYRFRKEKNDLPVAECRFDEVDDRIALSLDVTADTIVTWNELKDYVETPGKSRGFHPMGRRVKKECVKELIHMVVDRGLGLPEKVALSLPLWISIFCWVKIVGLYI